MEQKKKVQFKSALKWVLLFELLFCHPIQAQTDLQPYLAVLDTLQLSRVANLDFHPDYGLLIADPRELTVWRISPDGRADFIRASGQGPGEYERLNAVKWGPGGTIHIAGNTRVVIYSNSLEYLSWIRLLRPMDVVVSDNGLVFIAVRGGGDGPVVMVDPSTDNRIALTQWRDSNELTGIPDLSGASHALLLWNGATNLLYIVYSIDAYVEVIRDTDVIRRFTIPSERVQKSISSMKESNRNRTGNVRGLISYSLFSVCLTNDGNLLFAHGGELIYATPVGEVMQRTPWPTGYRQFYSGPDDFLFTVNRETMKIECFRLGDLFPEMD